MTKAMEYLETLQAREPGLFSAPLQKSPFTEADLQEIEQGLGHALPEPYREFLQGYQLPNVTVYVSFCGDYACSFWHTFSREKNGYIRTDDEDFVTVDMNWYGINGVCAADFVEQLAKQAGGMAEWLEAGFIQIADFYMGDYLVFYDLVTGKVLNIHNEDINESVFICDNWDNPAAIRTFMETEARELCHDFYDFLRLACTGEPYDENDMRFPEDE